jgi:hypothetical protein
MVNQTVWLVQNGGRNNYTQQCHAFALSEPWSLLCHFYYWILNSTCFELHIFENHIYNSCAICVPWRTLMEWIISADICPRKAKGVLQDWRALGPGGNLWSQEPVNLASCSPRRSLRSGWLPTTKENPELDSNLYGPCSILRAWSPSYAPGFLPEWPLCPQPARRSATCFIGRILQFNLILKKTTHIKNYSPH